MPRKKLKKKARKLVITETVTDSTGLQVFRMRLYLLCLVWLLLGISSVMANRTKHRTRQEILQDMLNKTEYDSRVAPNFDDEYPTLISVQIFVLNFDSVTETDMEYSLTIFLRQNWTDDRLTWKDDVIMGRLEVDPTMMDNIWRPDLYFINEKRGDFHEITKPNKLLHIYNNGSIHYSTRLSMSLSCDMYLHKYPLDVQECSILLASYSYSKENIIFNWHGRPVIMRSTMTLPRFHVEFQDIENCEATYGERNMIVGNYSCIQANFHLEREYGYYFTQVYVPTVLIVVLSWVSFWIDADATPARVSVGLLTVLAMTTQTTGQNSSIPKVSYIKALDVWNSTCLFFVFTALLEFAFVNVKSRVFKRKEMYLAGSQRYKNNGPSVVDANHVPVEHAVQENVRRTRWRRLLPQSVEVHEARFVDKCSRVVFPIAFLFFNLVYWLYYIYD